MKNVILTIVFVGFCKAFVCGQYSDSLKAYYPLDGNVNDYGTNGNHGKLISAEFGKDRFGNSNSALKIINDKGAVKIDSIEQLNISTDNFSISIWIKSIINDYDRSAFIISKYDWAENERSLAILRRYDDEALDIYIDNDGLQDVDFNINNRNQNISDTNWHHIVFNNYNTENKIEVYLDGELNLDVPCNISPKENKTAWLIGNCLENEVPSNYSFKGYIDDIRIFNSTLDPDDIERLFTEDVTNVLSNKLQNNIKVYPNPTKDVLILNIQDNWKNNDLYFVRVTTMVGKIVYKSSVKDEIFKIDLNKFGHTGLYNLSILNQNGEMIKNEKIALIK